MRKYMALLIICIVTACQTQGELKLSENKINVVTSIYPVYDFTRQIGGEIVEVVNLIPTGVEPHEWTPRSQELLHTSKAQLFLYHGMGFEGWIDEFVKGINQKSSLIIREVSTGISPLHLENDHDHSEHQHGDHDHGDIDPHTWTSPKSALKLAENIKNALIEVDQKNKESYEKNYEVLKNKLELLDRDFVEKLNNVSKKEIVVSHQSFGYLCRDYHLTQYSIKGILPEAEPKSQDLLKLKKIIKEKEIKYIFFEDLISPELTKMLVKEAKVTAAPLHPLEGITKQQEENGANYFTLMEANLAQLVQALQ